MSHPMHALCSASCPSPASSLKGSEWSCFRGYHDCSGRKNVWMTNRVAQFARSIQCSSLTVMVMMLSMNPSIDASVAVMYTANARNSSMFNMIFPRHAAVILHRNAQPFSLYPPTPYSQASDHSVTDGLVNNMLLIGTHLVVNVGGVSSIVGDLVDAIYGAVVVPISPLY